MTLLKPHIATPRHDKLDQHQVDLKWMSQAIELAQKGEQLGEVPIAALIVDKNGKLLASATNKREQEQTVLGHAELVALHKACKKRSSWRLIDCTLYVTLEPCFMCAGALVQARIGRVVFAAADLKGGALMSLANLGNDNRLNHQFEVKSGLLENEASFLLKNFFQKKRKQPKTK
jgi:tRNA(adenine34) deaminase